MKVKIEDLIVHTDRIHMIAEMVEELKDTGISTYCPGWAFLLIGIEIKDDCSICEAFFPDIYPDMHDNKVAKYHRNCPCYSYPVSKTLPFLEKIIEQSKELSCNKH